MLISDKYRELNTELHARHGGYGSKGKAWGPRVNILAGELAARSILDYGCGKGSLRAVLLAFEAPYEVREYDPAVPGKDAPPEPADLVVCTDVLEHVEPECIDDVFADLVRLANKAVLVAAACRPGKRVLADGRPDHLTVQPPAWWAKRAARVGKWVPVPALRDLEWAAVLRK
jgi:2-polyprenyl-3-methyl-5-hydroxy-6-metoxy-1,4-benzoquinol methylase